MPWRRLTGEAPARPGLAPLIRYGADGSVLVDPAWAPVESAWYTGVASMARAGLGVIIDEVLLNGGAAQERLAAVLLDRGLRPHRAVLREATLSLGSLCL